MRTIEAGAPGFGRRARLHAALAAALYLALALWAMRAILPAPASTFAYPVRVEPGWQGIMQGDQKHTAALIARNVRTLVSEPWRLRDNGICYPAPRPVTLGEHMFGNGLLGVVPYVLTGDPVLTYNAVVVLTLWLPAMAMYALVRAATGSAGAALIAGLLFGLHPGRIGDPVHPYVHGNQWTPLALLFAHRLFTRRRWWDAAGLALFVGLQTLESAYPLLAFAILGGVYGIYLVVRNARSLVALAPKLLAVAVVAAACAALVLGPYLATRSTWGTLGGRATLLHAPSDFAPGAGGFPGWVLVLLASLGLLDRLRGPRRWDGYDPRLVYALAGLLVLWSSVWGFSVPLLGLSVPSLFTLAARVVPGLDAIRGGAAIAFGAVLVCTFLAGYGALALGAHRRPVARGLITTVLVAAACAEVFWPPLAVRSFGGSVEMKAYKVEPAAALVEMYRTTGSGPVLDLPFSLDLGRFSGMAEDVFLSAYHHRPVAACYTSFQLPIQDDIQRLAARLTKDRGAAEALRALGFETVVVDEIRMMRQHFYDLLGLGSERLVFRDRALLHTAYALVATAPVVPRFEALEVAADALPGAAGAVAAAMPPTATIDFTFRNGGAATYRHPAPLRPTPLLARWTDDAGRVIREDRVAAFLPLALAAGDEMARAITLPVPDVSGTYAVSLVLAATPTLSVARQAVRVGPADHASGVPR